MVVGPHIETQMVPFLKIIAIFGIKPWCKLLSLLKFHLFSVHKGRREDACFDMHACTHTHTAGTYVTQCLVTSTDD